MPRRVDLNNNTLGRQAHLLFLSTRSTDETAFRPYSAPKAGAACVRSFCRLQVLPGNVAWNEMSFSKRSWHSLLSDFFFFLSAPSIPKRGSTHLILSRYILFPIDTFYEGWHVLNWKTFTKKNKKRVPTSLSLSLSCHPFSIALVLNSVTGKRQS